jgi:protein-L-isoaspartate(D-aspartate) O-methyltransferase
MNVDVETASPDALRADLTAQLVTDNWIRTPQVEAAFRAVPRHLFVPDTVPPAAAYADTVVITKRDNAGNATSSVSAPWLSLSTLTVLQ